MKRPTHDGCNGSLVTTPRTATMIQLLGSGISHGPNMLSRDEFAAVKRAYGVVDEKPTKKPKEPVAPAPISVLAGHAERAKYDAALEKYKAAKRAFDVWQDPMPLMQAGADVNAMRHAEADGLRMVAWIAKHVQFGEDPLKVLVRFAMDAGADVDPADIEWAEADDDAAE